jgi:hypothetical protein
MFLAVAAIVVLPGLAQAEIVEVTITGTVIFNGISDPPLSSVGGGDFAVVSFKVDSDDFVDGVPGDVRGYVIDQSSFSLSFDTPLTMGLLDPFPAGETPYFGIVDGFPVSDGFYVSTSPVSEGGVPLEQEPFNFNYGTGYVGETLDSLDILDAVGTYQFDGLTRFALNLWAIFPDNVALEMDFAQMTIEVVGGDGGGDGGGQVPATGPAGVLVLALIILGGSFLLRRKSEA